jgi:hypothetical protein
MHFITLKHFYMRRISTFLFLSLLVFDAYSQITQPRTATIVTQTDQNAPVDFTPVNAASLQAAVEANDGATANVILTNTGATQTSQFLILRGFNFLIPPEDVEVTNITVSIIGNASFLNAVRVDELRLIEWTGTPGQLPFNPIGTAIQDQGVFPPTQGIITLGGPVSSFGSPTLEPALVNSPNFGIALQLENFTLPPQGINNVLGAINQIVVSLTFQPSEVPPLPVEFISFDARKADYGVQLTWKVGTEINVDRYEIERSTDGVNFKKIGTVNATQNSNYSFTDLQPINGVSYYRVRNIDIDGAFKYTTVLKYKNGLSEMLFKAFPTTTRGLVTFQHPSVAGNALIIISSLEGRTLRSITPMHGSLSTPIDLSAYSSGTYLLRYQGENGHSETFRIIKK